LSLSFFPHVPSISSSLILCSNYIHYKLHIIHFCLDSSSLLVPNIYFCTLQDESTVERRLSELISEKFVRMIKNSDNWIQFLSKKNLY
jgi:hypothetical protein